MMARRARGVSIRAALALALLVSSLASAQVSVPPTDVSKIPTTALRGVARDPYPSGARAVWELLGKSDIPAVHMAWVPGTSQVMFNSQPSGSRTSPRPPNSNSIVLDMSRRPPTWQRVPAQSNPYCCHAVQGYDGSIIQAGGSDRSLDPGVLDGLDKIRVYRPGGTSMPDATSMIHKRWYPTATLMPNKRILIIGGTAVSGRGPLAPDYEIWNPSSPSTRPARFPMDTAHLAASTIHWYPYNWVLPTGHVFTFIDGLSRIIRQDGSYVRTSTGGYVQATNLATTTGWYHNNPYAGPASMAPLTASARAVDVIMFGGNKKISCSPPSTGTIAQRRTAVESRLGSRFSFRLRISMSGSGSSITYSFSPWLQEDMGVRRVGGQATMLPNGDTVLTGGSQAGCVGNPQNDVLPSGLPALWSVLYQPDRTTGSRYTVLNASTIARSYHDSAVLTPDGTILAAGCDVCNRTYFSSVGSFYSPNDEDPTKSQGRREYRMEIMHPPYVLDTDNRPTITRLKDDTNPATVIVTRNGESVLLNWSGAKNVTGVALVPPSTSTHNFDANQRVVFCNVNSRVFSSGTSGTVNFTIPGNANIAIRQYYMVFALNGKTYSKARWLRIVDP